MSFESCDEAECEAGTGVVELVITPKTKDLGEFSVRRILPAPKRQALGPFVFFDHAGPAEFPPGEGIAVRPHPHIGIATITYLFEGEIIHKDSLGYEQSIQPRAVNLMTAGKGIVHSERAGEDLNQHSKLHGIQSWIALPEALQEMAPDFVHYPASDIPKTDVAGVVVHVIMGDAFGCQSPVKTYSPTLYLELEIPSEHTIRLPREQPELAAYIVSGEVCADGCNYGEGRMLVVAAGQTLELTAREDARVMVIGGENLGPRHVWWNFVSTSEARIELAKQQWANDKFDPVPGDAEFIPLPES